MRATHVGRRRGMKAVASVTDSISAPTVPWDVMEEEADKLLQRLFPICRSITGNGVRETLSILKGVSDFNIREIPSGTRCHDWTIPDEWNVRSAYIEDCSGAKIVDFADSNIHLVSYSVPIDKKMSFQELDEHLHTLPDLPNAIPYRTSYYRRDWGFCLSYEQYSRLDRSAQYHVRIDSDIEKGSLTLGDFVIEGDSGHEFLISAYCCHPSLGNDNLSGQVLWALLLRELKSRKTRHSYRFVIAPETIGAIAYLSQNEKVMKGVSGGFVLTTVAGPGKLGFKHTFLEDHLLDRVVDRTFLDEGLERNFYAFDIKGSDERQYSSQSYRIPMGTICKDKYYEYDYYHTSLDNLDFISAKSLVETLKLYLSVISNLEMNSTYRSLNPNSEPMLSKRGLYPTTGGQLNQKAKDFKTEYGVSEYSVGDGETLQGEDIDAMLWVMFYSDGELSLLDISDKTGLSIKRLHGAATNLRLKGLLEEVRNLEGRAR